MAHLLNWQATGKDQNKIRLQMAAGFGFAVGFNSKRAGNSIWRVTPQRQEAILKFGASLGRL
ncbi:hypothetical protein [Dickeya dadantii]|uniref:hypothetical protein n=1 Tax=Dickeya dadantii TaxID=204038 RepID=UPI003CC81192